jgi:hypothetical protein
VNPSVSIAMWVYGNVTFLGALVRVVAQVFAGFAAFPLLRSLTPAYVAIGGKACLLCEELYIWIRVSELVWVRTVLGMLMR